MTEMTPHQGPASEPKRKINMARPTTKEVQPGRSEQPSVESTPPPAAPEKAAEELALKQQIGEMARTIGDLKRQLEQQQAEFQLRLRALQAGAAPAAQAQQQQPQQDPFAGVDPNEPVTMGQFLEAMRALPQVIQTQVAAEAIRATWSITPEQEQQILQRFPEANRLPEPDRTRFILDAAERLGLAARGSAAQTLQQAASTPAAQNPVPQQAPDTVPLVETPSSSEDEPMPTDELGELNRRYEELMRKARNAPLAKQRQYYDAAQEVYNQILRAQGLEPSDVFDMDWEQST